MKVGILLLGCTQVGCAAVEVNVKARTNVSTSGNILQPTIFAINQRHNGWLQFERQAPPKTVGGYRYLFTNYFLGFFGGYSSFRRPDELLFSEWQVGGELAGTSFQLTANGRLGFVWFTDGQHTSREGIDIIFGTRLSLYLFNKMGSFGRLNPFVSLAGRSAAYEDAVIIASGPWEGQRHCIYLSPSLGCIWDLPSYPFKVEGHFFFPESMISIRLQYEDSRSRGFTPLQERVMNIPDVCIPNDVPSLAPMIVRRDSIGDDRMWPRQEQSEPVSGPGAGGKTPEKSPSMSFERVGLDEVIISSGVGSMESERALGSYQPQVKDEEDLEKR